MFFCNDIGLTGIFIVVVVSAQRGGQPMAPHFRAQGQPSPTNAAAECESKWCPQPCQKICNAMPNVGCMPSCTGVCKDDCAVVLSGTALASCQVACVDSICRRLCKAVPNQPCLPACNSACIPFCVDQLTSLPPSMTG